MLIELAVRDLGIIDESRLLLGPGMTALTGETGAGKTMIVQAIHLLTGGRADPAMVRAGAAEAVVEGRFECPDGGEVVLRRVVPAKGRSRAYVDGDMATATHLSEAGARLVDLHGQHQHQSLLQTRVQRAALDFYGHIDLGPLSEAREQVADLRRQLEELGGDARQRAHEIDLLRYQLGEIDDAAVSGPDELDRLAHSEDILADATTHLSEAGTARDAIHGDGGVLDLLGGAVSRLAGRAPFEDVAQRLRAVTADLNDAADELRGIADSIEDDPARLAEVRARRQRLLELTRKYGDTLGDVLAFRADIADRLTRLERHEEVAAELEHDMASAFRDLAEAAKHVAEARRLAAPTLGEQVTGHLPALALERAQVVVDVGGDDPADEVEFLFSANSGSTPQGLQKVASGGELARIMLAVRLVLTAGPPTLVFDEVDAGVGGEAAVAVGQSLGALGATNQVLVVTHLPQVAAFADQQVVVHKTDDGTSVSSTLEVVNGDERVRELARMLAGQPESAAGREHASELLALAAHHRERR